MHLKRVLGTAIGFKSVLFATNTRIEFSTEKRSFYYHDDAGRGKEQEDLPFDLVNSWLNFR